MSWLKKIGWVCGEFGNQYVVKKQLFNYQEWNYCFSLFIVILLKLIEFYSPSLPFSLSLIYSAKRIQSFTSSTPNPSIPIRQLASTDHLYIFGRLMRDTIWIINWLLTRKKLQIFDRGRLRSSSVLVLKMLIIDNP